MANYDPAREDLINQLGRPAPPSGNTGFSGFGTDPTIEVPPLQTDGLHQPAVEPPDAVAPTDGAPTKSPFESSNATVRGYLDEAMRAFAPTVKGIKDEAGRKKAVEDYTRSLAGEVEKRGGTFGDIRGEKAIVDGQLVDFFRDIEGAAEPQYLVDDGSGGQVAVPESALLGGDMGGGGAQFGDDEFFRRLMAQVQQQAGPASTDRQALIELLGV